VIASLAPDLDGLGLLFGQHSGLYERFHHVLLHNLLFGALLTLASARWIGWRASSLVLVFGSFVAHLVGDYFGSGPGWALWPFWPVSDREVLNPNAWAFVSWQNNLVGCAAVAFSLVIAIRAGRTPLEFIHLGLDRSVVDALQLRVRPATCAVCARRATARCHDCRRAVCPPHVGAPSYRRLVCVGCWAEG